MVQLTQIPEWLPEHLPARSYMANPVNLLTAQVLGGLCYDIHNPGIFTDESGQSWFIISMLHMLNVN
jgi:hypothetical protein